MIDPLFQPVPGFDQPIAVLKHCHDRIRKQIRTMQNLVIHLPKYGPNLDAKQGANAVLRYFEKAAPQHHADEEEDLFPMLQAAVENADAELLAELLPQIMREHEQMALAWQVLEQQLKSIAAGESALLSDENVRQFAELYAAHMEKEETQIAPMAKRVLGTAQMNQLGNAMSARRGIAQKIGN
jgi:hemerythrin-like domain-containing protein